MLRVYEVCCVENVKGIPSIILPSIMKEEGTKLRFDKKFDQSKKKSDMTIFLYRTSTIPFT